MIVRFSPARAAMALCFLIVSSASPVQGPFSAFSHPALAQADDEEMEVDEMDDEDMGVVGPSTTSPGIQLLHRAVGSGDIAKVRAELAKTPELLKGNSALAQVLFLNALNNNKRDIAALFLPFGANVDAPGDEGRTPLEQAISNGRTETAAWLLEQKANINIASRSGQTPIFSAFGHPEILKTLLDKGASLTVRNARGQTPLLAAVESNNTAAVRALLSKGADIKARGFDGQNALHVAARRPTGLIKILLQAGAEASAVDARGNTPLHVALRDRSLDILEIDSDSDEYEYEEYYEGEEEEDGAIVDFSKRLPGMLDDLVEKSDVNVRNAYDQTPMLLALLNRDTEGRALILEKAPKMDKTSALFDAVSQGDVITLKTLLTERPYLAFTRLSNGMTPLHMAALWGSRTAADALLAKGVDVNARDGQGTSPLLCAVSEGANARRARVLVPILLAKGAKVNMADARGQTALLLALKLRDKGLLTALVAGKANVSARDKTGRTPLHVAVASAKDLVAPLLAAGADINARDYSGDSPLHVAAGASSSTDTSVVSALLAKGADINARNSSGVSPLGVAMGNVYSSGGKALVKTLVDAGADVMARSAYGESPLATAMGNKEILPILLSSKKLDLNARDRSGLTMLMRAVQNNNADTIRALLARGADASLKDASGQTALEMAQKNKAKAAIEALQANAK